MLNTKKLSDIAFYRRIKIGRLEIYVEFWARFLTEWRFFVYVFEDIWFSYRILDLMIAPFRITIDWDNPDWWK